MKIRRVSASALQASKRPRGMSPREANRARLEGRLASVIALAQAVDGSDVYRIVPENEKPTTIRLAFQRIRERVGSADINLRTVGGEL